MNRLNRPQIAEDPCPGLDTWEIIYGLCRCMEKSMAYSMATANKFAKENRESVDDEAMRLKFKANIPGVSKLICPLVNKINAERRRNN